MNNRGDRTVGDQRATDLAANKGQIGAVGAGGGMDRDAEIDAKLIRLILKKDQRAFEELYYRYHHRLARFIYRMGGASMPHEEIINDTMYVVWDKAEMFDGNSRPSTWIFGIAYNKTLKAQKASYREQPDFDSEQMEALENVYSDGSRSYAEQLESENWFASAFALLSPEQRATMELTFYDDMSYQEIAELMQCSENTVKTRMFHARKKLKSILLRLADTQRIDLSAFSRYLAVHVTGTRGESL